MKRRQRLEHGQHHDTIGVSQAKAEDILHFIEYKIGECKHKQTTVQMIIGWLGLYSAWLPLDPPPKVKITINMS